MKKGKILVALMIALGSSAAMAASANTTTANFQVSATVTPSCVVEATNIAFGEIKPATSGTANSSGSLLVTCTKTTAYNISLAGNFTGNDNTELREMSNADGDNKLSYKIFFTPTADAGSAVAAGVGNGAKQNIPMYGFMPLNQFVAPGIYTDDVTVKLDY